MKRYQVTTFSITIPVESKVALTEKQAALRAASIKKIKGGGYEVIAPLTFKRGEVIGYDGELPKVLATELVEAKETGE